MAKKSRNGMTFEGVPKTSDLCPISNWLTSGGTYDRASVTGDHVKAWRTGCLADIITYDSDPDTTESVKAFIRWFDQGPYESDNGVY